MIQTSLKKPSDWTFRGFTPLRGLAQNELGDWTYYIFDEEFQNSGGWDRMNCVTNSIINCLQTLYYYQYGVKRQFSKRYIAQLSGTTHKGNTLENVFDTIKEYGLVDEELYPDDASDWAEYYKDVPQDIINEGKDFLTKYDLYREWVNPNNKSDIIRALDDAPLQVTVLYASGSGILNPSSNPPNIYNHAVELFHIEQDKYQEIFDSEPQANKKYHPSYKFGAILKPTIKRKNMNTMTFQDNQTYLLVEGPTQALAMALDGQLMIFDEWSKCLVNSASRSKRWGIPIPLNLSDWNSIPHVNSKGELI